MSNENDVIKSSGNVFADLDVSEPEEALAKAELARMIGEIISDKNMNQVKAAEILGIDQPKVSALLRGRLAGFSTARLMKFLTVLGRDVDIVVKQSKKVGRIKVVSEKRASA